MRLNITKLLALVLVFVVLVSTAIVLFLSSALVDDIEKASVEKRKAEIEIDLNKWAVLRILNSSDPTSKYGTEADLGEGVEVVSIYDSELNIIESNTVYTDSDTDNSEINSVADLNEASRNNDDIHVFPISIATNTNPIREYEDYIFSQLANDDSKNAIMGYAVVQIEVTNLNLNELKTRIMLYFLTAILIVVAVSLFAVNRFIGIPIRKLSRNVENLVGDDISDLLSNMKIELDEVSNLANGFLKQQTKIMETNASLEYKVEERTRQLGIRNTELRELAFQVSRNLDDDARRIAAEVHDVLCSKLLKLKNEIDISLTRYKKNSKEYILLSNNLLELQRINDDARLIVSRYRLNTSVYLGLRAGLEETVNYVCSGNGNISDIEFSNNSELLESVDAIAFPEIIKITQEALLNIIKHASADNIKVLIDDIDTTVRIKIEDDGKGIQKQALEGSHGLTIMRERAEYINGKVDVSSSDKGTTVELHVPTGSVS